MIIIIIMMMIIIIMIIIIYIYIDMKTRDIYMKTGYYTVLADL